jgi:vitamin K-dependent gamma-carboxylase
VFFPPAWPRRWLPERWQRWLAAHTERPASPPLLAWSTRRVLAFSAVGLWCAVHVALPLRHRAYGGDVLWHEQGMRWSWKVMVREKNGSISYRVRLADGREQLVSPRRYLTSDQEREMSGQPDLIVKLGRHIAHDFRDRGHGEVAVYVDALVSLNGRPPALLIDPRVDLTSVPDGLAPASFILPAPRTKPILLRPVSG